MGPIRRREISRDDIMATYFMRATDADACVGCGACVEVCPVQAVTLEDVAVVDEAWCIGCGVCATRCPTDAITVHLRTDVRRAPAPSFLELHETRLREKGLIP